MYSYDTFSLLSVVLEMYELRHFVPKLRIIAATLPRLLKMRNRICKIAENIVG